MCDLRPVECIPNHLAWDFRVALLPLVRGAKTQLAYVPSFHKFNRSISDTILSCAVSEFFDWFDFADLRHEFIDLMVQFNINHSPL